MRTHATSLACLPLLATLLLASPASAQTAGGVVVVQPSAFADTAVASCAGGAAIGYLVVVASGGATPFATAALFCGLSVAATAASTVAVWTWRTVTSPF
jgi:uncharacterized membrane protein YebE (DUF533 family)